MERSLLGILDRNRLRLMSFRASFNPSPGEVYLCGDRKLDTSIPP